MVGLVGAADRNTEVLGLRLREDGQLDTDALEVEARDFFVEVFRQTVNTHLIGVAVLPKIELSERLVSEASRHHEGRVAGGTTEVHEAAFGEQVDALAVREGEQIVLWLDGDALHTLGVVESVDLDLVVEVADVTDNGLVLHHRHVLKGNNVFITGGGNIDVGDAEGAFEGIDLEAFHGGLEGVDGVDLSDDDASTEALEGEGRAFAHIAVAADAGDLAGDHGIGGALQAVGKGFAAAVEVIKLGLGDRVVDVDCGDEELTLLVELVEAVDAGGGLFRDAAPFLNHRAENALLGLRDFLEEVFDDLLFVGTGGGVNPVAALLKFVALVEEERHVAAVVDDHLWALAAREADCFPSEVPIFFEGFALPSEDWNAGFGDGRSSVVLSGEDVAGGPADISPELNESLNEDGGLDRHVQRTSDANALQGLLSAVFLTERDEAGHFVLSDVEFFATPISEGDVFDVEVAFGFCRRGFSHGESARERG